MLEKSADKYGYVGMAIILATGYEMMEEDLIKKK